MACIMRAGCVRHKPAVAMTASRLFGLGFARGGSRRSACPAKSGSTLSEQGQGPQRLEVQPNRSGVAAVREGPVGQERRSPTDAALTSPCGPTKSLPPDVSRRSKQTSQRSGLDHEFIGSHIDPTFVDALVAVDVGLILSRHEVGIPGIAGQRE